VVVELEAAVSEAEELEIAREVAERLWVRVGELSLVLVLLRVVVLVGTAWVDCALDSRL